MSSHAAVLQYHDGETLQTQTRGLLPPASCLGQTELQSTAAVLQTAESPLPAAAPDTRVDCMCSELDMDTAPRTLDHGTQQTNHHLLCEDP